MKKNKIIVLVGPTASGKSELGVRIAKKINGEIVSADSRQIYRGLDVGSGKIRGKWVFRKEKNSEYYYKDIRHHCIDIADPKKVFTAADFVKCGQRALANILSRGKTPIIVGGTGFYIDALLGKIRLAIVPPNKTLRKKLASYSTTQLFNYLARFDPTRAKTIDKHNKRRLVRAIEIAYGNPKVESRKSRVEQIKSKLPTINYQLPTMIWLGIKRSPEELKKRIHKRLITRLPGVIREIKKLHRRGVSWKRMDELGLEYRYVPFYVRRKLNYKLITAQLQTASWHYAKRQMTWWRKNKEIRWFNAPEKALKYMKKS